MESNARSHEAVRTLWHELLRGAVRIEAAPPTSGRELLLAPSEPPRETPERVRRMACIEAVVRGRPQKAVAQDVGVSPSTVVAMLKEAAAELGLSGRFSRLPVALPLLAHAACGPHIVSSCELGPEQAGQQLLLSVSQPDEAVASSFSLAEQDVMRRYISGMSHAEIAAERGTALRTIANQLTRCFGKLETSGRFCVIAALIERSAALGKPLRLALEAPAI